ncbi:DUF4113 domain-containing protein [Pseudomonas sp. RW3S2]
MRVLDQINGHCGHGILRTASVLATPDSAMGRELISQNFTTRLD